MWPFSRCPLLSRVEPTVKHSRNHQRSIFLTNFSMGLHCTFPRFNRLDHQGSDLNCCRLVIQLFCFSCCEAGHSVFLEFLQFRINCWWFSFAPMRLFVYWEKLDTTLFRLSCTVSLQFRSSDYFHTVLGFLTWRFVHQVKPLLFFSTRSIGHRVSCSRRCVPAARAKSSGI